MVLLRVLPDCTACESGFEANASGFCLEGIGEGTECFEEGDTKCMGYTFYECDNNLEWDNKGIVIGNCSVECFPVGNTSCQGDYSLLCGLNYDWAIQGNIDGLCGYVSLTGGTPLRDTYSNGDESSEEGDEIKKKSQGWIVFLIVAIFLLVVMVVFVLFKIFNRARGKSGLITSTNSPTPPKPKTPPSSGSYS